MAFFKWRLTMKAVDLFAGCGGMSLGFQNAGFNIVAAFEFWDIAAECYEKNFNHPVFRTDLSDVDLAIKQISAFSPDLIIGGPPCQDFSHAGKRIESSRASLTESYAQIVSNIHPKYFVMENVDRAEKSHAFEKAKTVFKNAGYGLTQMVLDASKCGVPQKRKRFFCIGALGKDDDFMRDILISGIQSKETTLRITLETPLILNSTIVIQEIITVEPCSLLTNRLRQCEGLIDRSLKVIPVIQTMLVLYRIISEL